MYNTLYYINNNESYSLQDIINTGNLIIQYDAPKANDVITIKQPVRQGRYKQRLVRDVSTANNDTTLIAPSAKDRIFPEVPKEFDKFRGFSGEYGLVHKMVDPILKVLYTRDDYRAVHENILLAERAGLSGKAPNMFSPEFCTNILLYTLSNKVPEKGLKLARKFLEGLDFQQYLDRSVADYREYRYYTLVDAYRILKARLDEGIVGKDNLIQRIAVGLQQEKELFGLIRAEIPDEAISSLERTMSIVVNYRTVLEHTPMLSRVINAVMTEDEAYPISDAVDSLEKQMTLLLKELNQCKAIHYSDADSLSLNPEKLEDAVKNVYDTMKDDSYTLKTGLKGFNGSLGGGFMPGRVYVLLGAPGEGKSLTMLDVAMQVIKYNPNYKCKQDGKKPYVLFVTMENSMEETLARFYQLATGTPITKVENREEAIKQLLSTKFGNAYKHIDLKVRYINGGTVSTDIIDTLIDEYNSIDNGECIMVIQDYLKRIHSIHGNYNGDFRRELGEIVNEFKNIANDRQIPILTASQLNRAATSKLDRARSNNDNDLVKKLGRENIADSILILENADWVGFIVPEYRTELDKSIGKYLGLTCGKSRYYVEGKFRDIYLKYKNDEYRIKLMEDEGTSYEYFRRSMKDEMQKQINQQFNSGKFEPAPADDEWNTEIGEVVDDSKVPNIDKLIEQNEKAIKRGRSKAKSTSSAASSWIGAPDDLTKDNMERKINLLRQLYDKRSKADPNYVIDINKVIQQLADYGVECNAQFINQMINEMSNYGVQCKGDASIIFSAIKNYNNYLNKGIDPNDKGYGNYVFYHDQVLPEIVRSTNKTPLCRNVPEGYKQPLVVLKDSDPQNTSSSAKIILEDIKDSNIIQEFIGYTNDGYMYKTPKGKTIHFISWNGQPYILPELKYDNNNNYSDNNVNPVSNNNQYVDNTQIASTNENYNYQQLDVSDGYYRNTYSYNNSQPQQYYYNNNYYNNTNMMPPYNYQSNPYDYSYMQNQQQYYPYNYYPNYMVA